MYDSWRGQEACDGRHRDDVTLSSFEHARQKFLDEDEMGYQVDLENLLCKLNGGIWDSRARAWICGQNTRDHKLADVPMPALLIRTLGLPWRSRMVAATFITAELSAISHL